MTYPLIQCVHTSAGHNLPVSRIVIHGTVSPCVAGGARNVARYFQQQNSGGSAQYLVDPGEIVQCATDDTICWHAPPNQGSIGIELCDPVSGSAARWADASHDKMLRLAAGLVRSLCAKYGIPVVKLSVADLLAGKHGICGHVDVSQAWHQTDHTDPGASFPWPKFIGYIAGTTPTPTPTPEVDMPLTDADAIKVAEQVWHRFVIHTPTGNVSLADALARIIADIEARK